MALAAVLAVSLTACGGQAEPTSSNAASGPATTTSAAETSSSDGIGDSLLESTPETTTGASQGGQTGGNSGTTKADTNKTNKPTAPTPTKDPSDSKATLPKLDIKDKNITVCIDWSPESNWVKGWVSALNLLLSGHEDHLEAGHARPKSLQAGGLAEIRPVARLHLCQA